MFDSDSSSDYSQGTPPVFAESLVAQVNKSDISSMVQTQREMLSRYEKTNEMLINFNMLSSSRYEAAFRDFSRHTQVLYEMKKDLDVIFKRIRSLKQRLSKMHPEAFSACSDVYNVLVEGNGETLSADCTGEITEEIATAVTENNQT